MRSHRARAALASLPVLTPTGTDAVAQMATSQLESWLTGHSDHRPRLGALYLVRSGPDLVAARDADVVGTGLQWPELDGSGADGPAAEPRLAATAVSEPVKGVDDDEAYDSLRESLDQASEALLARVEELEAQRARLDAQLLETYAALHTVQDQQAEAINARYPSGESRAARAVSTEQLLVHELGAATAVPHAEAQRRLVLALARRRHRDLHARLAAGSVSLLHATLIEGATRELPDEVIPALVAKVLALMPDGSRPSHQTITRRLRRAIASAADPLEAAARRRRGLARRGAYGQLHEDGTGSLSITTSAEQVVAILARMDALARRMRQQGDPRNLDQLRSDLATRALLSHRYGPCPGHAHAGSPGRVEPEATAGTDPDRESRPRQDCLDVGGLLVDPATGEVIASGEVFDPEPQATADRSFDTGQATDTGRATDTGHESGSGRETATVVAGTGAAGVGPDAATDAADRGSDVAAPGTAEDRLRAQGWTGGYQTGPLGERCGCVANPPPAHVWIIVPLEVATGTSNAACELPGHGWVTAEHARAIITAPGSEWRWLAVDQLTGRALRLGTTRYRPTPAMVEQVRALDGHCRGPGCTVPAHVCDLDHHIPYPAGPTCVDTLGPLHRFHHNTKTANLWTCTPTDGHATTRALRWTTLAGRAYTTYPKDYRAALNDPPHPFDTPRPRTPHRATADRSPTPRAPQQTPPPF